MSEISWDIVARDKSASATFNKVGNAASKTSKDFDRFNKSADDTKKKSSTFGSGISTGFAVASAAVVAFGATSVKAYAEAETSQLKLEDAFTRFPKLADVNIDALRDLNSELANKTRFDDDAYASGQAILAQYNLTGTQLQQLTPLLGDYAAKTGKDLPTAAATLGKAFLGNTRALKELGISYQSTGDQATDVANITQLLREKVGGFAEKEGKTAAGQAEIWKNRLGELQEALGETILKVANWAYENKGLVITLASIAGAVLAVRIASKAWHAVLDTGQDLVKGYRAVVERVSTTWGKMGSTSKGVVGALGALGLVAGGVGIVMGALAAKSERAEARQRELAESAKRVAEVLQEQNGVINENVREVALKEAQDKGWVKLAREAGISATDLSGALLGEGDARERVAARIEQHIRGLKDIGPLGVQHTAELLLMRDGILGYAGGVDTAVAELEYMQSGLATNAFWSKETAAATEGLTDKYAAQVAMMDKILAKRNELAGAVLSEREAQRSYQAALDDATAAIEKNGRTLDINTEAGRENQSKLDALAKVTTEQVIPAMLKNSASNEQLRGKMVNARAEFIRTAHQMGMSIPLANRLADKLGLIPGNYKAHVDAETAKARYKAAEIKRYLEALNGNVYRVLVDVGATGSGLRIGGFFGGGRAAGGPVKKGKGYWVGEEGKPEWFEPKQDGTIFTEKQLKDSSNTPRVMSADQLRDSTRSLRLRPILAPGSSSQPVNLTVLFSGSSSMAEVFKSDVRTGKIKLVADGAPVKVG